MGFLSDAELASLRLARMSLHIVSDDIFRPEPELPIEHDDFLLDRIRDVSVSSVYRFIDNSITKTEIENIARRSIDFERGAQKLANNFSQLHRANTRDGAFFVFELGVDQQDVRIYALMKYDYREALELVQREGTAGLRRIIDAFVSDKSAIQKSALIRVVNGVADNEVSTRDRMGRPSPEITEYFLRYLQVERSRSDLDLTNIAKEIIRTALVDYKELLPRGGVAVAVSTAYDVLRNAPEVNEAVIAQAVWVGIGQPEDDEFKGKINASVERLISRKKISGISFVPEIRLLRRNVNRIVRTEEGVTIQYDTNLEGQSVRRVELSDGTYEFIVKTRSYTDDVLPENARRPR